MEFNLEAMIDGTEDEDVELPPVLRPDGTIGEPTPQLWRAINRRMEWGLGLHENAQARMKTALYNHRRRYGTDKRVREALRTAELTLNEGEPVTFLFPKPQGYTAADGRTLGRIVEAYDDALNVEHFWAGPGVHLEPDATRRDLSALLDPSAYKNGRHPGRFESGYVQKDVQAGAQTHTLKTKLILEEDATRLSHIHYGLTYLTTEGKVRDKLHVIADVGPAGLTAIYHLETDNPATFLLEMAQQPDSTSITDHQEREFYRQHRGTGGEWKTDMATGDVWMEGFGDDLGRGNASLKALHNYKALLAEPEFLGGPGLDQAVAYATAHHDELRAVYGALSERKENGKRT